MRKTLLPILLLLCVLFCSCARSVEPAAPAGEDEPTASTSGETEKTVPDFKEQDLSPIERADLSLYSYEKATGGNAIRRGEIRTPADLKEQSPETLPVYADTQEGGLYRTEEEITDAEKELIRAQMQSYIGFLPEGITVTDEKKTTEADGLFGIWADADGVAIWGRPGLITFLDAGIDLSPESADEEAVLRVLDENPFLKAACEYQDITSPQMFFERTYEPDGTLSDFTVQISEKGASLRESVYADNFRYIRIYLVPQEDGGSSFVFTLCTADTDLVAAEMPILSYADAVKNLLDKNCFYDALAEEIEWEEETILTSRLVYRNDLVKGFYIPCYSFSLKTVDSSAEDPQYTTLLVPACNYKA